MAKDTEITLADFFAVRERVTDRLKRDSRQERATLERTVEKLLELGYLDLAYVRDEIASEKAAIAAEREAEKARRVANGAGQQKAAIAGGSARSI